MMFRIEWTREAQSDFAKIDDHYADIAPEFADKVGRLALKSARFLTDYPGIGEKLDGNSDVRKWHVETTAFLLLYRVLPGRIQILRVRHAHEDWKPIP